MNDVADEAAVRRIIDRFLTNSSGAAAELAKCGPSGVRVIASMLADPDPITRERSAKAAGILGPRATQLIPPLLRSLADPVATVRTESARALGHLGSAATEPLLGLLRTRPTTEVLAAASAALAGVGVWAEGAADEILHETISLYRDGHTWPADSLRMTLWQMSDRVRSRFVAVLYETPELATLVPLHTATRARRKSRAKSKQAQKGKIAEALFDMAVEYGPFALTEVVRHLDSPHHGVRTAAVAGLANAANTRLPMPISAWSGVRRDPVSIGIIDTSPALPGLSALLDDPDPQVRQHAIEVLGRAGAGAVGLLIARLNRSKPEAQAALQSLGHLGSEAGAAFEPVCRLVRDQGTAVWLSAVFALAQISVGVRADPAELFALLHRLPDDDPPAIPEVSIVPQELTARHGRLVNPFQRKRHRIVVEALAVLAPPSVGFLPMTLRDLGGSHPLVDRAIDALGPASLPALLAATRFGQITLAELIQQLRRIGPPALPMLADTLDFLGPSMAAFEFLQDADEATVAQLVSHVAGGGASGRHALLAAFLYHQPNHLGTQFGRLLAATFVAADRGEAVGMVASDPTERRVLDHLAQLEQSEYLPIFRMFWCVGQFERDAMRTRDRALGFARLQKVLTRWRAWSGATDFAVSESAVREGLFRLEGLFDSRALHDVWGTGEVEPAFRVNAPQGRRVAHRWAPRADKAWRWIDRFLARHRLRPVRGGDPGPNATIEAPLDL